MIVTLLIQVVLGLFTALLSLLPSWTWAVPGGETIALFSETVNNFVPFSDLVYGFGIIIALRLALLTWGFFVFVYDKLPFKSA